MIGTRLTEIQVKLEHFILKIEKWRKHSQRQGIWNENKEQFIMCTSAQREKKKRIYNKSQMKSHHLRVKISFI